ncbi:MAG TPA: discoidin domain-containing protein [Gemmatimonadaceae bacterium]|nr:discoidin domain-containing protein [Gemmatimonadaceae bacterium]
MNVEAALRIPGCVLVVACSLPLAAQEARVIDDFTSLAAWTAVPSDGVSLRLVPSAGAMRMDIDFRGGGGYAVARRAVELELPENYEISFRVRGTVPANNLEFKLSDSTGDNVWWLNRRDFAFPRAWTTYRIKRRHISFAWGPLGGGELRRARGIEIAVTAGQGGKGSVWVDDLRLTPLPPVPTNPPAPVAIDAPAATDGDSTTIWRSHAVAAPALTLDLGYRREFGGIVIDWDSLDFASAYDVQGSTDRRTWRTLRRVARGNGGRDWLYLPESEAQWLRLTTRTTNRARGIGIREIRVKPLEWSASPNAFFADVTRDSPPGNFPRYWPDRQTFWTLVGVEGDFREALVSEDGALESDKGSFTVEPFLWDRGRLLTWNDVQIARSLEDGDLPVPTVQWRAGTLTLDVTSFASGRPGASTVVVRYRVTNHADSTARPTLFLAIRPFQVNSAWQFLNTTGGFSPIRSIVWRGGRVHVNDTAHVVPLQAAAGFGATTLDAGDIVDHLRDGRLPSAPAVRDSLGFASGALRFPLTIAARSQREVWIALPARRAGASTPRTVAQASTSLETVKRHWRARLDSIPIILPASGAELVRAMRSSLAHILLNRDGPRIQPGSRSYERSWIRDGALTSAALLRIGGTREVREFIDWYAPFQYENGKVPCCVDHRGADPVPEHDSHGELIYLIAEYVRLTGDTAVAREHWPRVLAAVGYIDTLRRQRLTPEYESPEKRHFRGILPPSIIHEGYSAKPMHSYWDDFFALRGLKDAAELAVVVGDIDEARRLSALADTFRVDLVASIENAMRLHNIDFIPGAADLGDFDATSTTVGLAPGGELHHLPRAAVERTFARYYESFLTRRDGPQTWDAYTPYEFRVPGSLVRLGWRDRALEVLDWLFDDKRPPEWNQWPEVVWRDPRIPRFFGDLPHGWVASDFIRSVLDLFAYEDERDTGAMLVIGAGVRDEWLREGDGVRVRAMPTRFGRIGYHMRAVGDEIVVTFDDGFRMPAAGILVRNPSDLPARRITVDGRESSPDENGDLLLLGPAREVRFSF